MWYQTLGLKRLNPYEFRAEDFSIEEVAKVLSHVCRYRGHVPRMYSVAEHSILVANLCPPKHRLWGLLHDVAEAYLGDVPTLEKQLPHYRPVVEAEERILRIVAEMHDLPYPMPEEVKTADRRALEIEVISFFPEKCPLREYLGDVRPMSREESRLWRFSLGCQSTAFYRRYLEIAYGQEASTER